MFDNLQDRLSSVFKKFTGQGRLDPSNIQEGLREVRLALLEADVNFKVAKDFIAGVEEKCLGQDVLKSLTPGQQVVKIVHDEMVGLLGGETAGLELRGDPAVIMMAGLQGSGKTTTAAKLSLVLRQQGFKPYLVPADVYRPAAIDQLKALGRQLDMPVFPSETGMNPVDIAIEARAVARSEGYNVMLLDTAGRLHIDEPLMAELLALKEELAPQEILFVADAMTGQDAVTVAAKFDDVLSVTGVVLTKMDGDARGGAALSIKHVTGKPIKYVGVGEKIGDLEVFHPDRAASRILGMGDVLTLIEKAQETVTEEEAEELGRKLQKAEFTFEDFQTQMRRMKKLGSLEGILKLVPGMGGLKEKLGDMNVPDKELARVDAMINSMTKKERQQPSLLNPSRIERIAKGSGVTVKDVQGMVSHFTQMRKMMKKMMGGKKKGKMPGLPGMGGLDGSLPGMGMPGMEDMPGMGGAEVPKSAFTKAKKGRKKRVKPKRKKKK